MLLQFELDFLPIDVSGSGATRRMRERIRAVIAEHEALSLGVKPVTIEIDAWHVRPFDLDNVAKQILDALSRPLAERDASAYLTHAPLPDDDIRYVTAMHVRGGLAKRTVVRVRVFPTHFEEVLPDPDAP